MRFRSTLASLLTVIMLFFSSFALNCEIRCDLKSGVGICHGAPHSGRQGTMHVMAGMDHPAAKPGLAFASQSQDCRHHVCAQQPVVMNEQQAALIHFTIGLGLIVPDSLPFISDATLGEFLVRGPPPFPLGTPVSLHTTLLI